MEIDLCKYKDLFGEPREGLRKYRIFDIAILKNFKVEVLRKSSQIQINIELKITDEETLYREAFINTFK